MPVKALVLGGTGYVGGALVQRAVTRGWEVTSIVRDANRARQLQLPGHHIEGDLTDSSLPVGLAGFDVVILAAALDFQTESIVMARLLDAAAARTAVVFVSGANVTGQVRADGSWSDAVYAEHDAIIPSRRSLTRYETELAVLRAAADIRALVVRPPMVWGNGGSTNLPTMIRTARQAGVSPYVGAGLVTHSHVHVDDLGDFIVRAAERGRTASVYHPVAGEVTIRSLAEAVAAETGTVATSMSLDELHQLVPAPMGTTLYATSIRINGNRSRRELDWQPTHADPASDIAHSYRTTR